MLESVPDKNVQFCSHYIHIVQLYSSYAISYGGYVWMLIYSVKIPSHIRNSKVIYIIVTLEYLVTK